MNRLKEGWPYRACKLLAQMVNGQDKQDGLSETKRAACLWLLAIAVQLLCSSTLPAAESGTNSKPAPKPPPAPVSPFPNAIKSLTTFRLRPGFRLELVAAEPLLEAPVAMAFDEEGRLFVAEIPDYADTHAPLPHLGRIRMLEDTNGDGVFDTSTIYADNVPRPSALACYNGGLFVASTPNVLYLKDSLGTGEADVKKVVFTGFGNPTNLPNAQMLVNSFAWGLDNRIHGGNAGLGGAVTNPEAPNTPPILLGPHDFAFDPRTLAVGPESGSAQSGLTFDSRGREYVSDFSHPLRLVTYDLYYPTRNPFFPRAPEMVEAVPPPVRISRFISQRAGAAEEKRVAAGSAPSRQQTELRGFPIPSWMTMALGPVIYRGNLLGGDYTESVLIADPAQHVVHQVALQDTALGRIALGVSGDTKPEFLVSSESAFHPMQVALGPEGGLYIADFREGVGSGRIYRLVPVAFQQPKPLHLSKASTHDLVVYQSAPNGWLADTASRLLLERRDATAIPMLSRTVGFSPVPNAKIRALHVLDGLGALKEADVLKGLQDADDGVREQAVRLSENLAKNGAISDALWNQLKALATDRSARVRYQLAFTLGNIERPDRARVLAQLPRTDLANPWMQTAILSSSVDQGASLFAILAADSRVRLNPQGKEFLRQLAMMIGIKGRMDEVNQVIDFIDRTQLEPEPAFAFLFGLGEGLYRGRSSLALVDPQGRLQRYYVQAASVAVDDSLVESIRLEGIRLLRVSPNNFTDLNDLLLLLFGSNQPQAVQSATIVTLARFQNPGVVPALIQRWNLLTPALRNEAVSALLIRHERIQILLDAVERGLISGADFPPDAIDYLCTNADPAVEERALRLFGMPPQRRPEVMRAYEPALRLQGTPTQGRQIFLSRCASCHKLGNEGQSFGPDLTGSKSYGRQAVLQKIVEPNVDVPPAYASVVLETKGGDTFLGIVEEENPTTIILKQPRGQQAVWRLDNIERVRTESWSFMPTGLEQGLSVQTMADLLEYLMTSPR